MVALRSIPLGELISIDMLETIKVNGTSFTKKLVRMVKFARMAFVEETIEVGPFGIDGNPLKNTVAIYAETSKRSQPVVIGYINRDQKAAPGELRIFSKNANGEEQTYIWLKANGTIEIDGNANFAVKFNELKTVVQEIQNDIGSLKAAFNSWVVVPNDGGGALKASSATWAGTPITANIDTAKNANIKTS